MRELLNISRISKNTREIGESIWELVSWVKYVNHSLESGWKMRQLMRFGELKQLLIGDQQAKLFMVSVSFLFSTSLSSAQDISTRVCGEAADS